MKQLLIFAIIFCSLHSIKSHLTIEEMHELITAVRDICEQKTGATQDIIDGLARHEFNRDRSLMCYTHCIVQNFNMIKRGKLNADLAIKNIKIILPPEIREQWLNGVRMCRNAGEEYEDPCERFFEVVVCMYKNNEHFVLT